MAAGLRPKDQYTNEAYHELLTRWFQYAAFSPIFRVHGWISNAEIWNYGPQFLDIATQYDELRYHLLPYIYSSAWGVTDKGETLMRALPLEFSSDAGARTVSDEFMFGSALLINPITTQGAKQRTVYLPAGNGWIDLWTGKHTNGGRASQPKPSGKDSNLHPRRFDCSFRPVRGIGEWQAGSD